MGKLMAKSGGTFRRKLGTETWHSSEVCTFWPKHGEFFQIDETPSDGSLCNECKAISARSEDGENDRKRSSDD
jgi:hypothetical protein